MRMRLSDAMSTARCEKRAHRQWRQASVPPMFNAGFAAIDDLAASDTPASSIDSPGAMDAAMILARAEAEEEKSIQGFLIAYVSFVLLLAVLFVFVCIPP